MKKYLVLASLAQPNAATGKKVVANIAKISGRAVSPIWFDAAYFGIPVESKLIAADLREVLVDGLTHASDLKDLLIIELGGDWWARPDSVAQHWLSVHVGRPVPRSPRALRDLDTAD